MTYSEPLVDEDATEAAALAAAIAESDADPRNVSHEDVRAWLLRVANGELETASGLGRRHG